MTFLSASHLSFPLAPTVAEPLRRPRAPALAHVAAMLIFAATATVPGAVAQAKWSKIALILTFMEKRCLTS